MFRILFVLLRFAVPVLIVYGAWTFLRPKWAFTIVMDRTGMRSHTGVTTPQQRRLLELLRRTRFVEGEVKICGRHDENGELQLRFFGRLSGETEQQIRNYIVNEL
jgi:hypothetical protein